MRNVCLKLVASTLVLVAATTPAAAQDAKSYPGVACLGSRATNDNIERQATTGRAENAAAADTAFFCPAVKDGNSIAGARVYVIDQRANAGVACQLRSGRPNGAALWFASSSTAPGPFGPNPVLLAFGALPGLPNGHYWLTCTVPGPNVFGQRSALVSYHVTENP
ncbi:MAG TPA: hypothetical protein VK932_13525 [Kofleriaceae bacterium]|nr:hypothetical protein [Kofleriaceae bacterium]